MERPPLNNRRPLLRAFALLLLVALALLLTGLFAPAARTRLAVRGSDLYRRAGDSYVLLSYLLPPTDSGQLLSRDDFLDAALEQYRLSVANDPNNLRAALSEGLVLRARHREAKARELLRRVLRRTPAEQDRAQLRLLLNGPLATKPAPALLDRAYPAVRYLPPAPAAFAEAYLAAGQVETASRLLEQGVIRAAGLQLGFTVALAVCGLILALGVFGLLGLLLLRRRLLPGVAAPSEDWSWRDALEALLLFVLLQSALGALLSALPLPKEADVYLVLGAEILAALGAFAWIKGFAGRPARLGWRLDDPGRQLLLGAIAGGAVILPAQALALFVQRVFHPAPELPPLVPIFTSATDLPARLFLILGACAIIPAVEETLFRGVLYGALRRYAPAGAAALASALIFAGGHLTLVGFLPLALLGLVLAWLYERTGSLLVPAVAHGVFNAFSVAIMLLIYR